MGGVEYLITRDAAVVDRASDGFLVLVAGSRVDVAIADLERGGDRLLRLVRRDLVPQPEGVRVLRELARRRQRRHRGPPRRGGPGPYDKRLSDLIGELSTRSEEFRVPWAPHDVKLHRAGTKRFHIQSSVTSHSASFVMGAEPVLDVPAEDDLCWGLAVLECQVNDRGVLGRAVRGVRVSGGCCVTSGRQQNVSGLFSWSLASTRSAAGVDRGRARAGLGRGGGSRRALVG